MAAPTNTQIFSVGNLIGVNTNLRTNVASEGQSLAQNFALGTECLVSNGYIAVYVQNWGGTYNSIAANASAIVTVNYPTGQAFYATVGNYSNFSAKFESGDFGWVYKITRIG